MLCVKTITLHGVKYVQNYIYSFEKKPWEKPGNVFAEIPAAAVWFGSNTWLEAVQKPNLIVKLNAFHGV